ncbi:hypothetical protein HK101_011512 [Irineochytrium annulatum]|nr:hypothetical protein HK101_011512 [Irineochytrium annulatum]
MVIVTLVTLLVFILTVLIAGFIAKFLILYAFSDPVPADLPPPPPVTVRRRPDSPPSGAGLNRLTPIVIEKMAEDDYEDDYLDLFDLFFAYMDPGKIRLWAIDITHMVSGIFLVGFFGGISMLYYFVMNPMGLNVRLNARRGGDNMSAILILLLVTYGTFKALWGIYKTVKRVSRQSLQMVESTILDISEAGEGAHVFAPSGTVGNAHGSRERAGIANAVGLGGAAAEGPGAWAEVH